MVHIRNCLTVVLLLGATGSAAAQHVHRNGFESTRTHWLKAGNDAAFNEQDHSSSEDGVHGGKRCEYIKLNAQPGSHIFYQYSLGQQAPIGEELNAAVWVKANRPGMQVLARVILPNEKDPSNLENRLSAVIRGDVYRTSGRWQRLEIGRPVQLAKEQQQLMQNQLKRAVDFKDAYIDSVILNVFAGPGPTEVWIDDLEVGPVSGQQAGGTVQMPDGVRITRPESRGQVVEFNGAYLMVGGKRFFFRAINHSDTPLRVLHSAGLNTVFFNHDVNEKTLREAAELGLWIVPNMNLFSSDTKLTSAEGLRQEVFRLTGNDAILFWHLGGTLAYEQTETISQFARMIRLTDPGRPQGASVWDGMRPYSRSLELIGVHRWPLMTSLELSNYRKWIEQRERLANPGTFTWTWVQTHVPDWFTWLLYEQSSGTAFKEPVGPQAEHIRLLAYTAVGAGCKGLGFWSDRFLADSHLGRDRLLSVALINQELDMLEPLLLSADGSPDWIDTSAPDVKASVIRATNGVLVLPVWQGRGAQFVPGQAAVSQLSIVVPQIPQSAQAWEVTPGEVRSLRAERVAGGTKVTIPEFGLTTAIVFTSDNNMVIRFQEQARNRRQLAAQWTYDMALYEMEKVLKVEERLESMGHTLPDGADLIRDAQTRLRNARQMWESRLFREAYRESQRALRPMRILMRAQWEEAIRQLDSPVSTPYVVSFFTLPRHWEFMEEVRRSVPTANVLPGGDFEIIPERVQDSWKPEEPSLDQVDMLAKRVAEIEVPPSPKKDKDDQPRATTELPREGKQCLMLQIRPKNVLTPPHALERTLLAMTSTVVRLKPGTLVQISGWIRIPEAIKASADGALMYDTAGGEPLAIRLVEATPWRKFTLYRRVPPSGEVQVTLALTGLGRVYFDDVRIEPLATAPATTTPVSQKTSN